MSWLVVKGADVVCPLFLVFRNGRNVWESNNQSIYSKMMNFFSLFASGDDSSFI